MKHFRVFVQDRKRGRYSGYRDVLARDARSAAAGCKRTGLPKLHAVIWPPDERGNKWLDEFVNVGNFRVSGAKVQPWGAAC